jgi:type III secretion system YscJ/HrcJ family lipoprotein
MRSGNRYWLLIALVGALATGCKKEVYSGLSQSEANEIIVTLADAKIEADKVAGPVDKKGPTFSIAVPEEAWVNAMETLQRAQLPRQHERGLSEIFANQGMIPTETEEKARFLNGLQGDLVNSLEAVSGIVDARVHLVLPELNALEGKDITQARASVLIKYDPAWNKIVFDPEKDAVENAVFYRDFIIEINKDMKTLKTIWTEKLPALSAEDQKSLTILDTFLGAPGSEAPRRGEDEWNAAREARKRLSKAADDRLGLLNALKAMPKLKDLDGVIHKSDQVEINALPMPSAKIRSLVARATPRLSEDEVTVEFQKPVLRPAPAKVGPLQGIRKDYFFAAAGAAGGLAVLMIVVLMWAIGLKSALAKAEAKARAAAAAAPPASAG